jgi:hypothetical protein
MGLAHKVFGRPRPSRRPAIRHQLSCLFMIEHIGVPLPEARIQKLAGPAFPATEAFCAGA